MSSPRGKNLAIFGLGAMGYSLLELAWRKRTHWTMALTGGACLVTLCKVNQKMGKRKVLAKSLAGAGCITAVEFAVGCVVNKKLNMGVWDYSEMCIRDSWMAAVASPSASLSRPVGMRFVASA